MLGNPDPSVFLREVTTGLRELGYEDGRNIALELRNAKGSAAQLGSLARELATLPVDVIVAFQTPVVAAAKEATTQTPIVMCPAQDPIELGFVQSFARPGGNITGMTTATAELAGKNLQLIREVFPAVRRVGIVGNAADVFPQMLARHRAGDITIDVVTDQTSAHDPLSYLPAEVTLDEWQRESEADPEGFTKKSRESMAAQVQAMVEFQDEGAEVFDYGNSIRDEARQAGYARAFEFPGFVPAYIRPLFCEGLGPFRWAALSGDPQDIAVTDAALKELFPENEHLHRWLDAAGELVEFEGLPARICWLGYGERDKAGLRFNDMVANGEVSAPIVIGRDHLDCGSVASPYRETEAMQDGSDAIADWPLLNALVNTASGASWVSLHHGGGVGIGRSMHAGQVSVADGTPLAAQKLARVLTNDPGMGVIRHVDAGYDTAENVAAERGVRIPMSEG